MDTGPAGSLAFRLRVNCITALDGGGLCLHDRVSQFLVRLFCFSWESITQQECGGASRVFLRGEGAAPWEVVTQSHGPPCTDLRPGWGGGSGRVVLPFQRGPLQGPLRAHGGDLEPGWALSLASSQLSLVTPCVSAAASSAAASSAAALSDQSCLAPGVSGSVLSLDKGC